MDDVLASATRPVLLENSLSLPLFYLKKIYMNLVSIYLSNSGLNLAGWEKIRNVRI